MISQRMIAAEAGVERSTVSLALRDDPRIPEATRARVRAVAERLGYRPHPALSELARRRWRTDGAEGREQIAFIQTVSADHPVAEPARRRAEQLGYGLEVIDPLKLRTSKRLAEVLTARGIRGLLLEQDTAADRFRNLEWSRFVVVQCGLLHRAPVLDLVAVDLVGMVNEAVARLRERGARRIGFVLPTSTRAMSDLLLQQAVRGHPEGGLVLETPGADEPALMEAWRRLKRAGVDAVVALDASHERVHRRVFTGNGRPVCAALFRKPGDDRAPGFVAHEPLMAEAGIDLLVAKLRASAYGTPGLRRSVLLVPPWIGAAGG